MILRKIRCSGRRSEKTSVCLLYEFRKEERMATQVFTQAILEKENEGGWYFIAEEDFENAS
jgi:hypothetical protein